MRQIIKFLVAIALLGTAAFAIYMVQQDMDPLNVDDVKKAATSSKSTLEKLPKVLDGTVENLNESVIYKRKDAKGNWYYTNEPPKEGEESETLIYRSDTNVLPPLPDANKKTR
jgi:hypothetical protein